jgi:2-methylisocitrate lyase-like PEP mutase family enzyme
MMATLAALTKTLRQLHVPGKPLILTNIYDAVSARAVAPLAGTQALATASFAVAAAAGTLDDRMTLEMNLAAVRSIAPVAKEYGLPLTVDWQDGYGDRLEEGVGKLIELGVAGINLEDCHNETKKMFLIEEATERVKRVMAVAKERCVPDFVVNARADSMIHGGLLSEVIERGKSYLAAGATTVFVLGGSASGSLSKEEVEQLSNAFDGRLNAPLRIAEGHRTVKEWSELGVARLSIGPQLQIMSMKKLSEEADRLLKSR